jgi:hypothetical protein
MGEKILFEMRVNSGEHGTRIEISASPEWYDYHRLRRPKHRLFAWADGCGDDDHEREDECGQPAADDLRRALDSLQNIYNDLYGSPAEAG